MRVISKYIVGALTITNMCILPTFQDEIKMFESFELIKKCQNMAIGVTIH